MRTYPTPDPDVRMHPLNPPDAYSQCVVDELIERIHMLESELLRLHGDAEMFRRHAKEWMNRCDDKNAKIHELELAARAMQDGAKHAQ